MPSINATDIASLRASGSFDEEWYVTAYPDVTASGIDPAEHYLWIGAKLGRSPNNGLLIENSHNVSTARSAEFGGFGIVRHNPLISVIIVSYNSGKDLEILLPSLRSQSYKNFEVIVIENGKDECSELIARNFSEFKYKLAPNVGFAEANNLAYEISKGEFILLLNPDTRMDPEMLQNLLDSMRYDEDAAVAVPKINFFERFVRLHIHADKPFSILRTELVSGLDYRKIFIRRGGEHEDILRSDAEGILEIDLPYERPRHVKLNIHGDDAIDLVLIQIGYSKKRHMKVAKGVDRFVEFDFNDLNCSSARHIVNNAGSSLHDDGSPYDRAFGQYDDGAFYAKCYVQAFCGCVALIRRIAILNRTIFSGPFFAYYEDSELSHWMRFLGYRILYQPQAVVYHRHSESTQEHSLIWNILVGRSRRLYDKMTGMSKSSLSEFNIDYPAEFTGPLRDTLEDFDRNVRKASNPSDIYKPKRRTVCIYNSYFSSMGGGEKHAIGVASLFQDKDDVYLVSESDFDIEELSNYFAVDLSNVKKIISTKIDTHFSAKFDIFINSTFRSNLIPAAEKNYYIVSFPHIDVKLDILSKYIFLHNSKFTENWAKNYWGFHNSHVILPILGFSKNISAVNFDIKSKVILSVGRFTYDGHCKNHHIIVEAFRRIVEQYGDLSEWKLKIVGSWDFSQPSSSKYLTDLQNAARGYNVEILANASREVLQQIYSESSIYVHATGLGKPVDKPEVHEHFGITCFEAILHGCLPVVYEYGGPASQVENIPSARRFKDFTSLCAELRAAMNECDGNAFDPSTATSRALELLKANVEGLAVLSAS